MVEKFMKQAIDYAKNGIGKVNPNPLVGALIVKDNQIISKGYHEFFGGRHAEIMAIDNAKKNNFDIKGSDLYVTLEPCSHYGKTPPCVESIIREKFKRVFIGIKDPNPLVNGKGIEILREAGIEVHSDFLTSEITELNEIFLKFISFKNPFVAVKYASTLDGFIADGTGDSKWISNEKSRNHVHKLRNYYSSIMVGANTVLKDNPFLNCRLKNKKGRDPIKIILDEDGITFDKDLNIFKTPSKTIIFTSNKKNFINENVDVVLSENLTPKFILNILYDLKIDSVFIEGGAKVLSEFYDFADKFHIFLAPKIFSNGISPFQYLNKKNELKIINTKNFEDNIYLEALRCLPE